MINEIYVKTLYKIQASQPVLLYKPGKNIDKKEENKNIGILCNNSKRAPDSPTEAQSCVIIFRQQALHFSPFIYFLQQIHQKTASIHCKKNKKRYLCIFGAYCITARYTTYS